MDLQLKTRKQDRRRPLHYRGETGRVTGRRESALEHRDRDSPGPTASATTASEEPRAARKLSDHGRGSRVPREVSSVQVGAGCRAVGRAAVAGATPSSYRPRNRAARQSAAASPSSGQLGCEARRPQRPERLGLSASGASSRRASGYLARPQEVSANSQPSACAGACLGSPCSSRRDAGGRPEEDARELV
ncbi:hypothetical protein R6Z07M_018560 [Ovis aries]